MKYTLLMCMVQAFGDANGNPQYHIKIARLQGQTGAASEPWANLQIVAFQPDRFDRTVKCRMGEVCKFFQASNNPLVITGYGRRDLEQHIQTRLIIPRQPGLAVI